MCPLFSRSVRWNWTGVRCGHTQRASCTNWAWLTQGWKFTSNWNWKEKHTREFLGIFYYYCHWIYFMCVYCGIKLCYSCVLLCFFLVGRQRDSPWRTRLWSWTLLLLSRSQHYSHVSCHRIGWRNSWPLLFTVHHIVIMCMRCVCVCVLVLQASHVSWSRPVVPASPPCIRRWVTSTYPTWGHGERPVWGAEPPTSHSSHPLCITVLKPGNQSHTYTDILYQSHQSHSHIYPLALGASCLDKTIWKMSD